MTGATRGIGSSIALALSKAGADLILVQRNTSNQATKELIEKEGGSDGKGGKADIVVCDLASKEDVGKLIGHVTGELGRVLDIVVNCGRFPSFHRDRALTKLEYVRWYPASDSRGKLPGR